MNGTHLLDAQHSAVVTTRRELCARQRRPRNAAAGRLPLCGLALPRWHRRAAASARKALARWRTCRRACRRAAELPAGQWEYVRFNVARKSNHRRDACGRAQAGAHAYGSALAPAWRRRHTLLLPRRRASAFRGLPHRWALKSALPPCDAVRPPRRGMEHVSHATRPARGAPCVPWERIVRQRPGPSPSRYGASSNGRRPSAAGARGRPRGLPPRGPRGSPQRAPCRKCARLLRGACRQPPRLPRVH
jgi:hypothetical protein